MKSNTPPSHACIASTSHFTSSQLQQRQSMDIKSKKCMHCAGDYVSGPWENLGAGVPCSGESENNHMHTSMDLDTNKSC